MRRRNFPLPVFSIAVILLITGVSLILFFSESLFQIKTITIAGNSETVNTSVLSGQKNLLLLSPNKLKAELIVASPWIEDVEVKKQFPSTLILVIHERTPIAEYKDEAGRFFLDESGRLMPALSSKNINSVQVFCSIENKTAGQTITNELLQRGLLFIAAFKKNAGSEITKLTCVEEAKTIQLSLPDTTVLISPDSEPEETISSLQLLLKQFRIEGNRPETIDMRFEKPVLIPKGIEVPEASQGATKI